jgi:hypothetical protein
MKPESLLESDPINIYLTEKPKMPFRIPEEEPNGNYGLIINGYSLVGNTELQLCSLLPRNSLLRSNPLQGNVKTPSLFCVILFLLLQVPLPERHISQGYSRQE